MNCAAAYAVVHLALQLRSDFAAASIPKAVAAKTVAAAEESGGVALLRLTSCLNEHQLRPFIIRALTFASSTTASGNRSSMDCAHLSEDGRRLWERQVVAHRVLSFFRLIAASQTHFAALYGPVFSLGLPLAVRVRAERASARPLPARILNHGSTCCCYHRPSQHCVRRSSCCQAGCRHSLSQMEGIPRSFRLNLYFLMTTHHEWRARL